MHLVSPGHSPGEADQAEAHDHLKEDASTRLTGMMCYAQDGPRKYEPTPMLGLDGRKLSCARRR